jgi:hypothetical protein
MAKALLSRVSLPCMSFHGRVQDVEAKMAGVYICFVIRYYGSAVLESRLFFSHHLHVTTPPLPSECWCVSVYVGVSGCMRL